MGFLRALHYILLLYPINMFFIQIFRFHYCSSSCDYFIWHTILLLIFSVVRNLIYIVYRYLLIQLLFLFSLRITFHGSMKFHTLLGFAFLVFCPWTFWVLFVFENRYMLNFFAILKKILSVTPCTQGSYIVSFVFFC